jgi:hypothetical protein
MMIYPASMGSAYLSLEKATGDSKYFEAAKRIAEFYRENVLPSGSWYLLVDAMTGEPAGQKNCCLHFGVLNFLHSFFVRTGEECWHDLEKNYYRYIEKNSLENYNWEGQFEDAALTANYSNLTHINADQMISYISLNMSDDKEMLAEAETLMRFVEDQFVVWGEYPVWNPKEERLKKQTPAGLEQYFCYVPIDASAATIMNGFMDMYRLKKDRLYLEKAMTLGDTITRRQVEETGKIPTFWIGDNCEEGHRNYWINCQIGTGFYMLRLAELTEAEGIES